jgi:hypothetical protein
LADFSTEFMMALQAEQKSAPLIEKQLGKVAVSTLENLREDARETLAREWALEAARAMHRRKTGAKVVRGQDVSYAARRIGARIRAGTGEFASLRPEDRVAMIAGCPWC